MEQALWNEALTWDLQFLSAGVQADCTATLVSSTALDCPLLSPIVRFPTEWLWMASSSFFSFSGSLGKPCR